MASTSHAFCVRGQCATGRARPHRVHGFAIRDLKIDVQIPRQGEVTVEFVAPHPGRYEFACSEFCGSGHGQMKAALVSVAATPTRY